jgi:cullin-4
VQKRNTGNNEAESPALDNSLVFFRYIQSKDAFEVYYKRFLAKRLLLDRSSSHEAENRVLEKLKLECGHEFTKNLENMFSDIQVSTDLNNEFKEFSPEEPRLPIQVKVIAQATWPTYPISKMRLPADVSTTANLYKVCILIKAFMRIIDDIESRTL